MPELIHNPDNKIEIHHSSIEEIMSSPPASIVKIGSGITLIIFILFLIGSYYFSFSDVIKAPAVISSNKASMFLIAPVSGKLVKKIESDIFKVNPGDTIAAIESLTLDSKSYYLISNLKGNAEMNPLWSVQSNVIINDTLGIIWEKNPSRHICLIHLRSNQIGSIKIGNKINIHLDRFPSEEYGILVSKVRNITNFKNDKDYVILADLPGNLYTSKGKPLIALGKLTGTANIIVNEKSVFERLINPFRGLSK